jgi:hypothetical protein
MRQIQIRAPRDEDVACLLRELAVYAPKRNRRSILIELEARSTSDMLALLSAVETCVSANEIRSVRIELDGEPYLLAPR